MRHDLSTLYSFSPIIPPPPTSTLFPYTTLFRSGPTRTLPSRMNPILSIRDLSKTYAPGFEALKRVSLDIDREDGRSEEHTSELQSRPHLVCRLLLEKKNTAVCIFGQRLTRSSPP